MLRTIFGFEMPTRLLFGQGAVENLGFECSLNGWASALIVTDAGVPPAIPTAREKTYPFKPAGSPRFAKGTE